MSSWARRCTKSLTEPPEEFAVEQLYDAKNQPISVPDKAYFDVVVIGAGPAALTFVTRLLEDRPAALYLEDERRHLHWLQRKNHTAPLLKTRKPGSSSDRVIKTGKGEVKPCPRQSTMRVLVVDKLGDGWLGQWNRNFKMYEIPYLRSPMFFHPDPADLDGLLEYAVQTDRAVSGPHTYVCDSLCNGIAHTRTRSRSAKKAALHQRPDLLEVPGVVGREVSKHKWKQSKHRKQAQLYNSLGPVVNERDRRDYQNPSSELFHDFIETLVDRYHLEPQRGSDGKVCKLSDWLVSKDSKLDPTATILRADIDDMDYGRLQRIHSNGESEDVNAFVLHSVDGSQIAAKYVVSAVGNGGRPSIPEWLREASERSKQAKRQFIDQMNCVNDDNASDVSSSDHSDSSSTAPSSAESDAGFDKYDHPNPMAMGDGWAHAGAMAAPHFTLPNPTIAARMASGQPTTAVVIGGGLSSAQLADICVRRGFTRVLLLLRGFFKVKAFDFSLDWVGKYANTQKMQFWQNDNAEDRMEMIAKGRDGGSINPPYAKVLLQHARDGRMEICTHTEVEKADWDPETQRWSLMLHRKEDAKPDSQFMNNTQQPGTSVPLEADYIIAATGANVSFKALPFMKTMSQKVQVPEVKGVPVVDEDLQYGSIPLFCIGAFSALQVGPNGFNLGGFREGADRIVMRLRDLEKDDEPACDAKESGENTEEASEPKESGTSIGHFAHFFYHHLELDATD